ncbi:Eukaryotic translation initiation factor 2 subunit alpha [Rhynchospora pubera]|uniref:Eukaryotic translation initiation factor 2 subunit alpha n=1 Tax=Rhynchospora pubera TaxID=906938 RepID=A0AAV8BT97_9POAL|nr:Eukaryotic translation initiation factor 2 subunit alpha [Rhynchospora pubera]
MASPNLECRMYESKFPKAETVVMVQTTESSEMGTIVSLVEYNNINGLIFFTETDSRPQRRSISSLFKCRSLSSPAFKVEPFEPALVLRVNSEKGCIYLSKREVKEEDAKVCKKQYYKSMLVHFIMRNVAKTLSIDLEDIYTTIGWPLYRKYGHAFNALKLIANDPNSILDSITKEVKEVGPDGEEVPKMVPAVTEEMKDVLVKKIRDFLDIMGAFHALLPMDPAAFSFKDLV